MPTKFQSKYTAEEIEERLDNAGSGGGSNEPQDIKIRLDFAYDFIGTSPVNSLFSPGDEENIWVQDPRHQYLKITSTPITSEFEQAIKNGTGVIRFDYPIKTNRSNHDLHESGHKGFTRNLYSWNTDEQVTIKNPHEQVYKDAIIFLTEDDISTNRYGNKIIVKKFSMEEMSKMMIKFINDVGWREFNEVTDRLMSDAPNIEYYNGRILENTIENVDRFSTRKSKFNIGMNNTNDEIKSSNLDLVCSARHLPLYKTYFPMFIQKDSDLDFDNWSFNGGRTFAQYSLYAKRDSRILSCDFDYNSHSVVDDLSNLSQEWHNMKYGRDLGTKPRLAIINQDYENVGSDNIALSMWDKTYKQCEQMFSLKISSAYLDHAVNYFDEQTIIFAMRGQITEK